MNNSGVLVRENLKYTGTGGVSANNQDKGFVPAFMDTETGNIYRSRFANGLPAPIHVLAGLPQKLIEKNSVISGFLRAETFYSREEALRAAASGCMQIQ